VHDLSNLQLCALVVGVFVAASLAGVAVTRPWVRRWLGPPPASNEVVSYYLSAIGVFYGLTIGLVAVATWENFTTVDDQVSHEVASLAALYRDVSGFPEPASGRLRAMLRGYVDHLINVTWPAQRKGQKPELAFRLVEAFERELIQYQAATEGHKLLHQQSLQQYNTLVELVRLRLNSLDSGLPAALWGVLYAGAVLTVIPTFFFSMRSMTLHLILTAILAGLIGMLVFLIISMDEPFRGESGIDSTGFEQLRDGIMRIEAREGQTSRSAAESALDRVAQRL
jgi:hypothetical protein